MPRAHLRVILIASLFVFGQSLKAESVSRTPPEIYSQQLAALLTPLAQVMAGRDVFPKKDSHGVVLLDETVYYRDAAGTDYRLLHDVYLSHDDSAPEVMGNSIITYDREHESIFLIAAATIRPDGVRQDLDDRATFIQTPQHEAENGLYTSNQELNLIFPKVVPGAITESIVLIRVDKPIIPGEFARHKLFAGGWPTYKSRLVVDLPESVMQRVHFVAASPLVPEALVEKTAPGRTRKVWTRDRIAQLDWEESAPSIEFCAPTLWLSTLDSWDQITAWLDDLVKDRSELGPDLEKELEGWTAGLTAPRDIIAKLCAVVANDVRYTGLEFGLAGYQPYPCAQVWANRYGDCKDKANLLRALLARKGISSHLVLLQTERLGRIEKRSPSWRQFNHAILAVENGPGSYFFCDPTMKHLPAGAITQSDSARSVLVVKDRHAEWVQTPDLLNNAIRYGADLTLAPSGELSGWFSLRAEGADAAAYTEYYNNFDPPERRRTLQRSLEGFFQGAEIVDLDYHPVSGVVTNFEIRAYFIRKPNSATVENVTFPYSATWLPSVSTTKRVFPYATARRIEALEVSIALPAGWNARKTPEPFSATSSAARFEASWKNEPGRLRAHLAFQPEAAELSSGDYAVFQRSVRALRSWLEQPAQVARGENATTAPRTALTNFPVLATGEGQLRLLAQRFPSGEKDRERRSALEQVLQWFPDDIPTCFEAKVFIALIDADKDNARLSGLIRELLARYETQISSESRGWAQYLECRARWWATHETAAIKDLQNVASDKSLSGYRQNWSAYYAAVFLSEKDPVLALAYLQDFDTRPEEAQEDMLKLEARLLARLADPAATRQWAERIAKLPPENADSLLESALEDLSKKRAELPESAYAHITDCLTPVLQTMPGLTKAAAQLARIKAMAEAGRLRLAYTKAISAWLDEHPLAWITKEKSPQFTDTAALIKHIEAKNDAAKGAETIDAVLQLIRYHETDYPTFAKYTYWTAWWLHHDNLAPELLAKIAEESYALPTEESNDIVEIWLEYAEALQARKQIPAARTVYQKIIAHPGTRPYQRVETSGELALMELGESQTDAALADFAIVTKDHLTHRRGSEYLFAAMLLNLELHRYDQALELLNAMGEDVPKYREAIRYADTLKYLLPEASQPEALLKFWKRQESWRPAWDKLLRKYGVSPSQADQLPLIDDITGLQKKISTDVGTKNTAAFLRHLDLLVRNAQWIPLFTSNVCAQSGSAGNISPALHRDLYEFGLLLVHDFPSLDEVACRSARLWETALLADLNRPAEARPLARRLFEEYGTTQATGAAALRLWLLTSADSDESAQAIAAATAALKADKELNSRAETVEALSNALFARKDTAANMALLNSELNHPDITATATIKSRLTERLDQLRKDSTAGADFNEAVQRWLINRKLDWLLAVPPLTLDAPRYANPPANGLYESGPFSFDEATICNLRVALNDDKPMDLRYRAFEYVAGATGYLVHQADDYADHYGSALLLKSLPENIRFRLYSGRIAFLLQFGNTAAAAKLLVTEQDLKAREHWKKIYDAGFAAARVLENYETAKATEACQALLQERIDQFQSILIKGLLTQMVRAGDSTLASNLVEGATNLNVAPGFTQSANGLRLDWSRQIRRETANLPFYRQIREILARHCDSNLADAKIYRQLTWHHSLKSLDHQTRGRAIAAFFAQNLYAETDPSIVLGLLDDASTYVNKRRALGPDLETAILAADIDDSTRARWFGAIASLSDPDTPAVRERVVTICQNFLSNADASTTAETRRQIRRQLAQFDLRNSAEARPESIFGQQAISESDHQAITSLQFMYHCSRQQTNAALALFEKIDADILASSRLFPYAQHLLLAQNNQTELKMLTAAAREKLASMLPNLWIEGGASSILHATRLAQLIQAPELLPDTFFEHTAAVQADEFDRQMIYLARASLRQDWAAQKKSAEAVLELANEFYLMNYYGGEARFHLGDFRGAKKDLELFLGKALESDLRPEAQHMLDKMPRK